MRKILTIVMVLILMLTCIGPVMAEEAVKSEDTVILYTNDIHTYIDGALSYDVIAALKTELEGQYENVLLVDAGDHIQGTAYGSMDKGKTVVELMNAAGYDLATLGNHEFDYNMTGCMNVIKWAEFPYISCNFYHEEDGVRLDNVLDSYVLFECGSQTVAFIGITTPESFTKSTPAYFQDESGNYIYGISDGDDGALYADVQNAIDGAKAAGATTVIALGHLGEGPAANTGSSVATIAHVSGLDAFIDGHSHSTIDRQLVTDASGGEVLLTQTGEYCGAVGKMVIDAETGEITTELLTAEDLAQLIPDAEVKTIKDAWMSSIDDRLGQIIGSATVTLDNYDAQGNRLVRAQETNTGDFSADALYYLFDNMGLDVDVAVMNGGGVRNQAVTGDISYKTCKDIHTFGNVACLQVVTGQQLLDALEWSTQNVGTGEDGSFLHVSGLTYRIDTTIASTVTGDDKGVWTGGPTGEYRVRDVKIYNKETGNWDALDLEAEYNLAGYNYTLRDLGGGFAMLDGARNVLDYVMEDYMVLANYIQGFENGVVGATNSPLAAKYPGFTVDYSTVYGSGRIEVIAEEAFPVWVGGVQVTASNAQDVLGDGTVCYDAATGTLTLNNAQIVNEGGDGIRAVDTDLTVCGTGSITADYGICAEGGNVTVSGAKLTITAASYGMDVYAGEETGNGGNVYIDDGAQLYVDAKVVGIAADTNLEIRDSAVNITAEGEDKGDGLYAYWGDITVVDSQVTIQAALDGIYAYDGSVYIDCTQVTLNSYGPGLSGTSISVTAGGKAIFAYDQLVLSGKLAIGTPEGGKVQELTASPEDDEPYTYQTVVDGDGNKAKTIAIEPLQYRVFTEGLSYQMALPVPAGESVNAFYCPLFGLTDASELFDTVRENYTFGGWYTDEACTDGNEYSFDMPVAGDLTIYAKWVPMAVTPPTGDSSHIVLMLAVLLGSGVAVVLTAYGRKRMLK